MTEISAASLTVATYRLAESRAFFERHLRAVTLFDCGWYVALRLGGPGAPSVCLMTPQHADGEYRGGATLNLLVSNVDDLYRELTESGLVPVMPLADHPWGDRGFCVIEPAGVRLYLYQDIEPAPEYAQHFKIPRGS